MESSGAPNYINYTINSHYLFKNTFRLFVGYIDYVIEVYILIVEVMKQ